MDSLSDFKLICRDVSMHVDVLIKHSENYYFACIRAATPGGKIGDKALQLTKQAIGSEIVSRLYRLIKDDQDAWGFPKLIKQLAHDDFLEQLMPAFNHDGRKSLSDIKLLRDEVAELFENISGSIIFEKL